MRISVERILNKPIDSNSFVVYTSENKRCIIIDPGTEDSADLITFIQKNNLQPEFIFLTHEHFDHIWGVNLLKDLYNAQIVCSLSCAEKIVNKKKNMSVFFNQIGFELKYPDILIEEIDYKIIWNDMILEFINTEGHTEGSICIFIENALFTGDTLLKNEVTITKLPSGNSKKLAKSFDTLLSLFKECNPIIFPGHGELFFFFERILYLTSVKQTINQ